MKKPILYIFGAMATLLLFAGFEMFYPTGAPAGYTGSPGDGQNCTACHGGTATTSTGWITSNIPGTGYVPGQTYQITATNNLTGSGKYGFEVSPQNVAGGLLGTLAAGSGSQLVGSGKYVTHTNANITNNVWTFNWTAPATGTGPVTFYGAFAKGKPGPVTLSTLAVDEALTAPGAAGPISGPTQVCKSTTESYSIAPVAGATSYVWAVPSGSTIVSGQGTIAISVNYGSSAVSGNISVYGSNAAGSGPPSGLAVTVNAAPAMPGNIAGNNNPCAASAQVYSVTAVSGVSYTWTVPSSWTIVSGQGSATISVTAGVNPGSISVLPSNSCGQGPASVLAVSVQALAGTPGQPAGPEVVYYDQTPVTEYTITATPNADTYEWAVSPAAAGSISGNGLTGTVTWAAYTGTAEIRVKALNDCGEGAWSESKTVTVDHTTGLPGSPGMPDVRIVYPVTGGTPEISFVSMPGPVNVRLIDLSGSQVFSARVMPDARLILQPRPAPGLYLLTAESNGLVITRKLVVR
jgi:hypothetical protein